MLIHLVVAVVLGMQVMLIYILRLYPLYARGQFDLPEVEVFEYAVWALTTPVLLYSGVSFLRGAWQRCWRAPRRWTPWSPWARSAPTHTASGRPCAAAGRHTSTPSA